MAEALAWITAAVSLLIPVAVWRRRGAVVRPAYLEASLLLLLTPLISPQGWDYVLIVALPGFVCLLDRFRDTAPAWRAVTVVGLVLTSLTIFDLLGRTSYMRLMSLSVVSVGAMLLVASLTHLRLRRLA